ncbi:GIY-YIG nuclease family protein [Pseudopedobacter beijingensis]|uniref:GIY-YIG nuclease family protein n=1 Tax=Pseudopedobacter beijingensis TaxID=1207056 RepID=A0ABW4IAQ0_9SPHI
MKYYYVYILKCSDNSCYTGVTNNIERRMYGYLTGESTNKKGLRLRSA